MNFIARGCEENWEWKLVHGSLLCYYMYTMVFYCMHGIFTERYKSWVISNGKLYINVYIQLLLYGQLYDIYK